MQEVKTKSHTLYIIREEGGLAVVEISPDKGRPPKRRFYVVGIDHKNGRVYSVMPSDVPADGGYWTGAISPFGVAYVARPRTRAGAMAGFRRLQAY